MSIELTGDEIARWLATAPVGCLTTLRRDGFPVSMPMWFVASGSSIFFRSQSRARLRDRVTRDARAAFIVEDGEAWHELRAVHWAGHLSPEDDGARIAGAAALHEAKYAHLRAAPARLPPAAQARYGAPVHWFRFDPIGPAVSWDNRKLRPAGRSHEVP